MTATLASAHAAEPYRGLRYFTEADACFFFGREPERDLIIADLKASSLSLVYGQSGVGKSSLLRAGVAAVLRDQAREDRRRFGSAEFVPVVFANWRDDPLYGLVQAIAAAAEEFALGPHEGLVRDSLVATVEAAARTTQAAMLIILDQFEEYFLYHREDAAQGGFGAQFVEAVNRPGLPAGFLVALRDDALAQLDAFRGRIPKLFSSYRRLNPLSKSAARQAIVRPLEEYNRLAPPGQQVALESSLVEAVVRQVASGQVKLDSVGAGSLDGGGSDTVEAPYLQLVMSRLWQEETATGLRALRLSTLEALGGAQKIVRSHLDSTLGALAPGEQEVAADIFHHLVTPSGTKIAHTLSDLVDYTGWPEQTLRAVLERLAEGDTRIVRPVQAPAGQEGPPRYEIFHDVLAPAVLDWRGRHEKEAAERAKQVAEHERQLAEHNAWVQRRRAVTAWAAAGLSLALLAALAVVAIYAIKQANAERSRALAGYALSNLGNDPELSAMLALSGLAKSSTVQAEGALRQAYPLVQETRLLPWRGEVSAVTFSPGGEEIAAAAVGSKLVRVWGSRSSGHRDLPTVFSSVNGLAFSPDGHYLAVVGQVPGATPPKRWPGAEVIGLAKGDPPKVLFVPHADEVGQWGNGVAWAGQGLVVADDHGYLCLYPLSSPTAPRCRLTVYNDLGSLSMDHSGTLVAVSDQSDGAALYSVPSLTPLGNAENWGLGDLTDAVLSPDGRELATTSVQGVTMVYNLRSGAVIDRFSSSGQAESAAFSTDGSELATTTDLGYTTVWDIRTQANMGIELAQLNCDCGVVYSSEFDPTGAPRLVTGSADGAVRVWSTVPSGLLGSYELSSSWPFAFWPDGIAELSFVPVLDDVVALASGPQVTGAPAVPDRAVVVDLRTGRSTTLSGGGQALSIGSVSVSGPLPGQKADLAGLYLYNRGSSTQLRSWVLTNVAGVPRLSPSQLRLPHQWPAVGSGAQPESVLESPDARWLILQFSNAVDALNLRTGKAAVLPKTPGYNYYVNHMAFDAASRHVVIAYNSGTAWEWALPHSSESPLFVGAFRDPVANAVLWDAEFSPDGRELALADNFGNVTVFNTATKRQALPEPLNAGSGQVNSAVFGEGGKTVLTSGDDGTARVWDLATRRLLLSIGPSDQPYPSAVNSAVYGDLGGNKVLLLGSNDGFLRVWSTQAATPNLHELEALARERLGGRCYTSAELAEFSNPSQVSSSCRHG